MASTAIVVPFCLRRKKICICVLINLEDSFSIALSVHYENVKIYSFNFRILNCSLENLNLRINPLTVIFFQ